MYFNTKKNFESISAILRSQTNPGQFTASQASVMAAGKKINLEFTQNLQITLISSGRLSTVMEFATITQIDNVATNETWNNLKREKIKIFMLYIWNL